MKKRDIQVSAKITKAKKATMRFSFEIQFDQADEEAREQAAKMIAKVVREVLPAERLPEFMQQLKAAQVSLAIHQAPATQPVI